jgi:hypothetical protein
LLHIYENNPCTNCRTKTVEQLAAIDRLPDWMREECRYDASEDTRNLVRR